MKLLRIALLASILSALLTVAAIDSYRQDQRVIRWFPGTGIAGKLDVMGDAPTYVAIANRDTGHEYTFRVLDDGTFVAPLPPGVYELQLPGDDRSVTLAVPDGECLDLVLDFRLPVVVLKVAREGPPLPRLA